MATATIENESSFGMAILFAYRPQKKERPQISTDYVSHGYG